MPQCSLHLHFYKSDSRPTLHMVPEVRLELTRRMAPDPKSDASTNSTIQAYKPGLGAVPGDRNMFNSTD